MKGPPNPDADVPALPRPKAVGRTPRLFGPVLLFDLVRTARRGRYILFRVLYGGGLLVLLYLLYLDWFGGRRNVGTSLLAGMVLPPGSDLSRFADSFFQKFMTVQFVAVLVLTPACTATALGEEKQRRTLELLMTTDLQSHEIVLGKLLSRLAYLTLIILMGLPILSLLQLLGGVDPQLVLAGFAVTAVTMVSLASLSLLNSAYASHPVTAVVLTYLEVAAYLGLDQWAATFVGLGGYPRVLDVLNAGNVFALRRQLPQMVGGAVTYFLGMGRTVVVPRIGLAGLPVLLAKYAIFHAMITMVCLLLTTAGLWPWARRQMVRRGQRAFVLRRVWGKRRPAVGDRPMLWKELHAEPLLRMNRAGLALIGAVFHGSLLAGAFAILSVCLFAWHGVPLHGQANGAVRWGGIPIACLMLLGVAVRAAGSVGGERDRGTLDGLLSTSLNTREIVTAKWLGSMLCTRTGWWFLGPLGIIAAFAGGLHPVALLLWLFAWWGYAAFLAGLGLYFSVTSRTMHDAVLRTVLTTFCLCAAPWLLSTCGNPVRYLRMVPPAVEERLVSLGLSPPANLWFLAFDQEDLRTQSPGSWGPGFRRWSPRAQYPLDFASELAISIGGVMAFWATGLWLRFRAGWRLERLRRGGGGSTSSHPRAAERG